MQIKLLAKARRVIILLRIVNALEMAFSMMTLNVLEHPETHQLLSRSRFRHTVRRPGQIVCPNSDSVCPNSDKIYLTVVTFRFLLLFFVY